jgi:hypothetical protein
MRALNMRARRHSANATMSGGDGLPQIGIAKRDTKITDVRK